MTAADSTLSNSSLIYFVLWEWVIYMTKEGLVMKKNIFCYFYVTNTPGFRFSLSPFFREGAETEYGNIT